MSPKPAYFFPGLGFGILGLGLRNSDFRGSGFGFQGSRVYQWAESAEPLELAHRARQLWFVVVILFLDSSFRIEDSEFSAGLGWA